MKPIRLINLFKYYKALPHENAAIDMLEDEINALDPNILQRDSEWYQTWKSAPAVKPATFDNSWDGIYNCAEKAGAKFPECVAAQWALESDWGQHTSGQNNYFGIKGKGTIKTTWEDYGNGPVVIKDEFKAVIRMSREAYDVLGLDDFSIRLSGWDPEDPKGKDKYVDDPAAWEESEAILLEVLQELGVDYNEGVGEAAFYGPKLDFQFRTVTGREETVSTVQLDFAVPERMGLKYIGSDGAEHVPYCIHRAPFSTHERFVAFLIEHYAGAFPTWMAQALLETISASHELIQMQLAK